MPDTELERAAELLLQARRRTVLLVEDTAAHAALIRRAFDENTWALEHVTRASSALTSFAANPDRIVLLDLSLPDSPGLMVLQQLRMINAQAPIIIVTALEQVSTTVEAMQNGACDYVVKGDAKETVERISQSVERAWMNRMRVAQNFLIEQTKIVELVRAERLEAIEAIVRTVCHEVNNPLSGVVALSQLLQQHAQVNSEIKKLADGIFHSAQEVATAVQKLARVPEEPLEFGGTQILDINAPTEPTKA